MLSTQPNLARARPTFAMARIQPPHNSSRGSAITERDLSGILSLCNEDSEDEDYAIRPSNEPTASGPAVNRHRIAWNPINHRGGAKKEESTPIAAPGPALIAEIVSERPPQYLHEATNATADDEVQPVAQYVSHRMEKSMNPGEVTVDSAQPIRRSARFAAKTSKRGESTPKAAPEPARLPIAGIISELPSQHLDGATNATDDDVVQPVDQNVSHRMETSVDPGDEVVEAAQLIRRSARFAAKSSKKEESTPKAAPEPARNLIAGIISEPPSQHLDGATNATDDDVVQPVDQDESHRMETDIDPGEVTVDSAQPTRRSAGSATGNSENEENASNTPSPTPVNPAADIALVPVDPAPQEKEISFFYYPRNPTVPTGLKRIPFNGQLPKYIRSASQNQYSKIMRKIKVQKEGSFPARVTEAKIFPSVLSKRKEDQNELKSYPDDNSQNDPEGVVEELKKEKYRGLPDKSYMEMEDREELLWSAEKLNEHLENDKTKMDIFYKATKDEYLFTIWRQFEGHIPSEFALQNLQKNDYNIPLALGSIDQYLKILPQKMPVPGVVQVQNLAKEIDENGDNADLRDLQDSLMRNWHIGELHNFYYKFGKFFKKKEEEDGLEQRIACNCGEEMCRQINYEPRYGCANCTNMLRKNKLRPGKLCLICSTFFNLNGITRPAENTVFDEDDLAKIRIWDQMVPKKSREEFEKWSQDQKNERYKKLQLTQEEVLMLDFKNLTLNNQLAEQVTAMLQPYALPHFSHCRCLQRLPPINPPAELLRLESQNME